MPKANGKRVKLYIVIGLSILFVVVGYFRFFHGKTASPVGDPIGAGAPVEVTAVDVKALHSEVKAVKDVPGPPQAALRDIFEPGKQTAAEAQHAAVPSLKLTGTIIGGKKPLAFINGRTLRLGEKIEGFQVISITREQVTLAGEGRKLLLNVLEGPKNVMP